MNAWVFAGAVAGCVLMSVVGGIAFVRVVLWAASRGVRRPGGQVVRDDAAGAGADAGSGDRAAGAGADAGRGEPVDQLNPARAAAGAGPTSERAVAALRGGMWIGVLERAAVTAALGFGYPAGVAVVVAVKGLGRFSELRGNPDASERFVIGTLASLLWAALWGGCIAALTG